MAGGDTVAERMKEARFQTAARLREPVSGERMSELVGQALGRVLHPTQWRRYEGGTEPPLDVIRAAARVSGLAEAYIAFGDETRTDVEAGAKPSYLRAAERFGGEVAEGSSELPSKKSPAAKHTASRRKPKP